MSHHTHLSSLFLGISFNYTSWIFSLALFRLNLPLPFLLVVFVYILCFFNIFLSFSIIFFYCKLTLSYWYSGHGKYAVLHKQSVPHLDLGIQMFSVRYYVRTCGQKNTVLQHEWGWHAHLLLKLQWMMNFTRNCQLLHRYFYHMEVGM